MKRILIVAAAIVAMQASAETYTWKGGAGTVDGWNTSANWDPEGVPNAGDTAVFKNSVTISSAIALNEGDLTISVPSTDGNTIYTVTLSGVISGAGGILAQPIRSGTKNNTLAFSGTASTFTGRFRVTGSGITQVQKLANLGENSSIGRGTAGVPVGIEGGTFTVASTCSSDRPFYLPSNYTQLNANSGATVTLTGDLTGTKVLCRSSGNFVFKGVLSDAFTTVSRTDGGELRLDNDRNSFTVTPVASAGTLGFTSVADSGVPCALGAGSKVSIGQGNTTWAKFSYCGETDAAMDRTLEITYATNFTETNYKTYYKGIENRTAGTTFTFNGAIVNKTPAAEYALLRIGGEGDVLFNVPLPAGVYVTKYGSGTATIGSDSAQTKKMIVSDGRLDVAGSIPAASEVEVAGGTLGGTGVVHGATAILSTGALSAGTAAECGTLIFDAAENPLVMESGSSLNVKVDAVNGTNDMVVVAGAPKVTGVVTIRLSGCVPGRTYTVMKYDSPPANMFALGDGVVGVVNVGETELKVMVSGGALVWSGDAANNVWDFATANWNGEVFADGRGVSFTDGGVYSAPIRIVQDVAPAGVSLDANNGECTFVGAKITGDGGFTKSGAGGLTIANTNDYAGATVLHAGATTLSGTLSGSSLSVRSTAKFHETPTGVIAGDDIDVVFYTDGVVLEGTNTFSGRMKYDFTSDGSTVARRVSLIHSESLGNAESLTICPNSTGSVVLQPSNSLSVAGKALYVTRGDSSYRIRISADGLANRRFEWAGDIAVPDGSGVAPWLYIDFSKGSTFFAGTQNETAISGFSSLTFRGDASITMRGRVDTPGAFTFNDGGTRIFASTNNVCSEWAIQQGVVRTDVDHAFAANAVLKMGKSISGYHNHDVTLNLNGTTQQVAQLLEVNLDSNASGTRRIMSDAPATLVVKSDALASSYGSCMVRADGKVREGRIDGGVSLVKDGSGRFDLNASTNLFTGDVTVLGGTLAANAPFSLGNGRGLPAHPGLGEGDKDIVVAGGTLELNAEQEGIGGAVLSIGAKDGTAGVVAIAGGVVQRVRCLKIGGELRAPGVYGGAESAAPRRLGCFAGSGLLVVERGVSGGVVIFR